MKQNLTVPDDREASVTPNVHLDPLRHLTAYCHTFKGADVRRSILQLTITATLFVLTMSLMIAAHVYGQWGVIACLVLPASGLLIRLFIIQHDCGHGSYFRSRRANDMAGRAISLLTVTPYESWKRSHNIHHAVSGNLDQRDSTAGAGSIDTLTVREYKALPWRKRLTYRLYRSPLILLIVGTPIHIILLQRIPFLKIAFFESHQEPPPEKIWRSILLLDIAMMVFYGGFAALFGWQILLTVILPVLVVTSWIGGWLFFIQHQFEDTYWQPAKDWNFRDAALGGSSYYALPPLLQWFTGSIGLHHIHHLCSAIPNYRLQECLNQSHELQTMNRMTIRDSIQCIGLSLWDEDLQRMVSFRQARKA